MGIIIFFITAVLDIAFDQWTKLWLNSILSEGQSLFHFGFVHVTLVHNTGAAFGIFHGNNLPLAIIEAVGAVIILTIVILMHRRHYYWGGKLGFVALGLIFAGTIGNLIDRIHLGYVVDFIDLTYWPVFNVADSSVTIGVIILAVLLIWVVKPKEKTHG
jgi:signal peptidase II